MLQMMGNIILAALGAGLAICFLYLVSMMKWDRPWLPRQRTWADPVASNWTTLHGIKRMRFLRARWTRPRWMTARLQTTAWLHLEWFLVTWLEQGICHRTLRCCEVVWADPPWICFSTTTMHRNVPQVSDSLVNNIKTTYSAGQARFRHQGRARLLQRHILHWLSLATLCTMKPKYSWRIRLSWQCIRNLNFDWCCFSYFLRNSLVALLEALFESLFEKEIDLQWAHAQEIANHHQELQWLKDVHQKLKDEQKNSAAHQAAAEQEQKTGTLGLW